MNVCFYVKQCIVTVVAWCNVMKQIAETLSCSFLSYWDQIAVMGECCGLLYLIKFETSLIKGWLVNCLMVLTSNNFPYELERSEYSQLPVADWSPMFTSYCIAEEMNSRAVFPGFCHCHRKVFSLDVKFNFFVGSGQPVGGYLEYWSLSVIWILFH